MTKHSADTLDAIAGAVNTLAKDPSVPGVTPANAPEIADAVIAKVAPVVAHATNSEPWYQSRVFWGAAVSLAAGVAGVFGYTLEPEDQKRFLDLALALGPVIGAALALYGRFVAKKPIGS